MSDQFDMFGALFGDVPSPASEPEPVERPPTIQEKFEAFHAANPRVYSVMVEHIREQMAAGRTRVGIKEVWEKCRWKLGLGDANAEYRLNNDHTSRYARRIQEQEPDIAHMFRTRRLKS